MIYRNQSAGTGVGPCYTTHKPLVVGDFKIYGGSCSSPIVLNADVYVGLDHSMSHRDGMSYPWVEGESFLFHIPDMGVPKNPEAFKRLIDWLAVQLTAKKLVHVGCIGGHGRTGTVFAALVAKMTGNLDSIKYVREAYCHKAVESDSQVAFLGKHFGVLPAAPTKSYGPSRENTRDLFPTMSNPRGSSSVEYVIPNSHRVFPPAKNLNAAMSKDIWGGSLTGV